MAVYIKLCSQHAFPEQIMSDTWQRMVDKAIAMPPGERLTVRSMKNSPEFVLPLWKGPNRKEKVGWGAGFNQGDTFQISEVQVSRDNRRICARVGNKGWVNIAHYGSKRDPDHPVWYNMLVIISIGRLNRSPGPRRSCWKP